MSSYSNTAWRIPYTLEGKPDTRGKATKQNDYEKHPGMLMLPIIQALGKLRQDNHQLKACASYKYFVSKVKQNKMNSNNNDKNP